MAQKITVDQTGCFPYHTSKYVRKCMQKTQTACMYVTHNRKHCTRETGVLLLCAPGSELRAYSSMICAYSSSVEVNRGATAQIITLKIRVHTTDVSCDEQPTSSHSFMHPHLVGCVDHPELLWHVAHLLVGQRFSNARSLRVRLGRQRLLVFAFLMSGGAAAGFKIMRTCVTCVCVPTKFLHPLCTLYVLCVAHIERIMKPTHLAHLLLLLLALLCRDTAVRGFGLLPSSSCRNSPYSRGCDLLQRARTRTPGSDQSDHDHRVFVRMAFWEDIVVPGGGRKGTTTGAPADKCPVLICPAQLSVPGDYQKMVKEFKER